MSCLADTPKWVADAVVYQIFPDRFRQSGRAAAQSGLVMRPWGADPMEQGFQGGDLYGVIDGLDHLEEMGINCLYLNPIFCSAANHRYHTYDYLNVDPLLGGNDALAALIEAVHGRGMRLLLDGVFNHCGRGFWAFHHLLENGETSPYRDWFDVQQWPLHPYPQADQRCGYSCWWNDPALPKFNHANPGVQDYLLKVGLHWLEQGIDGWRLDVPDEVPAAFWQDFRRMVKAVNDEAWIVGEIWGDARPWLDGDQFDGVMNYRLGWSSLCWLAGNQLHRSYRNPFYPLDPLETPEMVAVWETTAAWYRPEVNCSQLNLLDSHDVPRALHTLRGDLDALKLALCLLFMHPGAPCLYYGTEVAMQGGVEPGCREAFPWLVPWPADLRGLIRRLVDVRRNHPSIRQGRLRWESIAEDGLHGVASLRGGTPLGHQGVLNVWVNRSRESWLPLSGDFASPELLIGSLEIPGRGLAPQSAVLNSLGEGGARP